MILRKSRMIMSFVILLVFTITIFAPVAQAASQPTVLWGRNCDSAAPSVGNFAVDAKAGNYNDMINNILNRLGYTKSAGEQCGNFSFLTMPQFGECILK